MLDNENNTILNNFDVPENYFQESKFRTLNKITNGGMTVPDHYFDLQREALKSKISPVQPKSRRLALSIRWVGLAASLLFISGMLWYMLKPQTSATAISNDEIVQYLMQQELHDVNEMQLVTTVSLSKQTNEEEFLHEVDEELLINEL